MIVLIVILIMANVTIMFNKCVGLAFWQDKLNLPSLVKKKMLWPLRINVSLCMNIKKIKKELSVLCIDCIKEKNLVEFWSEMRKKRFEVRCLVFSLYLFDCTSRSNLSPNKTPKGERKIKLHWLPHAMLASVQRQKKSKRKKKRKEKKPQHTQTTNRRKQHNS